MSEKLLSMEKAPAVAVAPNQLGEPSLRKRMLAGVAALTLMGGAAAEMTTDTEKADASTTVTQVDADVINLQMNLKKVKKFIKKCATDGSREDLPPVAPPADPSAKCNLNAKVKVGYSAKLACPAPYLGGEIYVSSSITQKLSAKSLAKSKVPSIVKARANLSEKIESSLQGSLTCVLPPVVPPKPPVVEIGPDTEIFAPEHMYPSGTAAICEIENSNSGSIVARDFSADRGSYISGVYPGNDPNEYCRNYRAPSTTGDVTVEIDVTKNNGLQAHDQRTFPVVADEF